MSNIKADIFLNFKGWDNFRSIPKNTGVITGLNISKLKSCNVEEKFFDMCDKFINDNKFSENKILLNRIQVEIISKGYEYTTDILIKLFKNKYVELHTKIQNMINEEQFSITKFVENYSKLNKNLTKLKYFLSTIDYSYKNENGKKSDYSFINLVKNYTSYNEIINSKYNKEDRELYLYELFIEEIENNFSTETILEIFKIYDFYNKFSFTVKNKTDKQGHEFFNSKLGDKIKLSDDTTNRFLSRIIEMINKKITDLANNSNIDTVEVEKEIKYIRKLIDVAPELCNKSIFMTLYKKALTNRLKSGVKPDLESEFLKSLNPQDDIDTYIKMKNQINDIKLNTQHNKYFRNVSVGGHSEKYKNIDLKKYDRNKVNVKVFRSYDWDYETVPSTIYNMPVDLSIYLDIFNAYYKDRFNERILSWIYSDCIGIIEIETDKVYNIKMNILQMAIYYYLNNGPKTASEISKEMKIDLQQLGYILNSLIVSKLICKEDGIITNNPDIKFNINEKFTFSETNISITNIYEKIKSIVENKKDKSDTCDSDLPSETILRAKILTKVMVGKKISREHIIDEMNNYFKINIPSKFYEKIINDIISSNDRIKLVENNLVACDRTCTNIDDIEDLDDIEGEDNDVVSVDSIEDEKQEDHDKEKMVITDSPPIQNESISPISSDNMDIE